MSALAALTLVAASAGTSFLTAAFGIGGGVVMLGILASLLPPVALIPVHGIVQLGSNLGRASVLVRHVLWTAVPGFAAGALVGTALGGMIVVNIPPEAVQIGVGVFILISIHAGMPNLGHVGIWLAGGIASFLSMFFGATGPFLATYLYSLKLGRMQQVATHATMVTLQHLLKVLAFGLLGFAFGPYLGLVAAMIATGFLGTLAGSFVLMHAKEKNFRRGLNILLTILAARLIWTGGWTLYAGAN